MSLNLIKNNSSSPFHLQRSIVNQGGEGGAYESGGYTGESQYSDVGISSAITSFGKILGAGIGSRTEKDENNANINKEARLQKRSTRIEGKQRTAIEKDNIQKATKLGERNQRVKVRKEKTTEKIKKYNESQKPTLKSDIKSTSKAGEQKVVESAASNKMEEERQSYAFNDNYDIVNPNS